MDKIKLRSHSSLSSLPFFQVNPFQSDCSYRDTN